MSFRILHPVAMTIDGKNFADAVKNYVKLNRFMNIEQIILADQYKHMRANVRYYDHNNRRKASIQLFPFDTVPPVLGFRSTVQNAPYPGFVMGRGVIGGPGIMLGVSPPAPAAPAPAPAAAPPASVSAKEKNNIRLEIKEDNLFVVDISGTHVPVDFINKESNNLYLDLAKEKFPELYNIIIQIKKNKKENDKIKLIISYLEKFWSKENKDDITILVNYFKESSLEEFINNIYLNQEIDLNYVMAKIIAVKQGGIKSMQSQL